MTDNSDIELRDPSVIDSQNSVEVSAFSQLSCTRIFVHFVLLYLFLNFFLCLLRFLKIVQEIFWKSVMRHGSVQWDWTIVILKIVFVLHF